MVANRFSDSFDTIGGEPVTMDEGYIRRRQEEKALAAEERMVARLGDRDTGAGENPSEDDDTQEGQRQNWLGAELSAGIVGPLQENLRKHLGIAEGLASIASGIYGTLAGGLAYLAGGAAAAIANANAGDMHGGADMPEREPGGFDQSAAERAKTAIEELLIHSPVTEEGRRFLETATSPLDALHRIATQAGDSELKRTNNPAWATTVYTAIAGGPMLIPVATRIAAKIRTRYNLAKHYTQSDLTDLVVQDLDDLLRNPLWKEKGLSEADIVRTYGGKYRDQAVGRRMGTEEAPAAEAPKAAKTAPETKTEAPKKTPTGQDGVELKGAYGSGTDILTNQGRDMGRYAVVELDAVIASHVVSKGFAKNQAYPDRTQERQYEADKAEQAKVLRNAQTYDPLYTINTDPTVVNGPPVVTRQGIVLGGNSRVMSLDEVYRNFPEKAEGYRNYLEANAGDFGLTSGELAGFKKPVLVRVVDEDVVDPKGMQNRVRLYNQPPTQSLEGRAEGISKAKLLSDETMNGLAGDLEEFGSLREYLSNKRSRALIDGMTRDGVIDNTQANKLIDAKSGLLTEDGKRMAEQVIRGRIFDDPALIQEVPPGAFQKIDMALPALAKLKARGGEWDVSAPVTEALRSYGRMKARGFDKPEEFLAQLDMFDKEPATMDPRIRGMLDMLAGEKPLEIKARFDDMARAAAADVPNQMTLAFFTPEKPADAFNRIFGPGDKPEAERLLRAAEPESPYDAAVKEFGEDSPMVEEQLSLFNEDLQRKLTADFPTYAENVASVSGKVGLEGAGIHTLGVAINAELVNTGRVELKGRIVKSAKDVAVMAQVFRDPRYETLRLIYVKGNQVVGHEGVSSRMPGFSVAFMKSPDADITRIKARMARLEADGYYMLHNHPSGNTTPSADDANLSHLFDKKLPGFKGHVIIDSGKYTVIGKVKAEGKSGVSANVEFKPLPSAPIGWIDPLLTPAMPHPDLGTPVFGPVEVAMIGARAKAPDNYVTIMYRSKGELRALQNVPAGLFNTVEHASNFLRGMARKFGAQDVVAYASAMTRRYSIPNSVQRALIENGSLVDLVYNEPGLGAGLNAAESVRSATGIRPVSTFGREMMQYKPKRVAEEKPEYRISPVMVSEKPADYQAGPPTQSDLFLHHPQPELKDQAININLKRIRTSDDIRETLIKVGELHEPEIQAARRGQVSREETARLADELGMTVEDLLARRQGQAFNAHEAMAARRLLVTSAQEVTALANRIQTGEGSPRLMLDFSEAYHRHSAIQAQVSGLTAEAGRTLDIFNRMAEPLSTLPTRGPLTGQPPPGQMGPPRPVNVKQLLDILDALGGEADITKIATAISTLDTPGKVSKFVRDSQKATTWEMFMEAWVNALLSGPATHSVNATSNALTAGWMLPERLLAAEIGRVMPGPREITEREALYQAYGLVQGARDGLRLAWQALKTGEPSDALTKIEGRQMKKITGANTRFTGATAKAIDLLGEAIRLPGRGLLVSDEFFKAVGYRMELNALAFRKASQEGKSGDALAARMQEIIDNPPLNEGTHLAAVDAARYQTFTNRLEGASAMIAALPGKAPALRIIMPFVKTPVNIAKFIGERTPLAPISAAIRADIAAGGARRDLALSKMALGSIVMAATAMLAAEDVITGAGPKDPSLRAAKYRTGWQPYSFKIGDTYISYGRLDPVGATLGLAADVAEIIGQADEESSQDLATAAVMSVARNFASKTYVRGLSEVFEVLSDPDRYGEKYLQRLAGTVIPTGVAQLERTVDPTLRDVHNIIEQIQSRIPGWSESLPPRRNLWGEPIVLSPGLGPDIMSPIYTSTVRKSPIDEEIIEHKVKVSMPSHVIDGVALTPQEYSRYVQLAGSEAKDPATGLGCRETLDKMVKSPEYKKQTDGDEGGKAYMILETVNAFRSLGRAKLVDESSDLRELVTRRARARAEALQPRQTGGQPAPAPKKSGGAMPRM